MPSQTRLVNAQKEGRLLLAHQAYKKGQLSSTRSAARLYNVPKSTLSDRLHGRVARVEIRANGRKLTPTEEEALEIWVLSMDARGYPLRLAGLRDAAKLLLQARVG